MTAPPVCRCHGEPMEWNKDSRLKRGGYWRCKVKHRASRADYERSAKGRATSRRYRDSPIGSLVRQLHDIGRVRVRY